MDITSLDQLPVWVAGEESDVIAVYDPANHVVVWSDDTTDGTELPDGPMFFVFRLGESVRVEFCHELYDDFPVPYALEVAQHEPFKVVILAGMVVNAARIMFKPFGVLIS